MIFGSLYRRWAIFILFALTLFRFWFCTYHELVEDEAYYRLWSQHLDWSYYSKGPLISWTIFLGRSIFGDTVFGIRSISVLLSAATGWMIFRVGSKLWNERVGFWALVIAVTMPLYAIGSVLMTIDPLSVFFWILAAHFFLEAIDQNRIGSWISCGFAVGFGFLAKFVNAIELICFLLFLMTDSEKRMLLRQRGFWITVLLVGICAVPVFYWNACHGWITATHLQERGALNHRFQFRLSEAWTFIYMQGLVISPLYFLGMIGAAIASCKAFFFPTIGNRGLRFATSLFLPIFLFYLILSFNDKGEANWTATGLVGGIFLLAVLIAEAIEKRSRLRMVYFVLALILTFIETVILHDAYGWGIPFKGDPASRLRGWSDLAQKVDDLREPGDLILGNKYQTASILAFYLKDRPTTHIVKTEKIQNQFSFWTSYELDAGAHGIFVTDSIDETPDALKVQFGSIEKIGDFYRQDRGRNLKRYQVYRLSRPIPRTGQ